MEIVSHGHVLIERDRIHIVGWIVEGEGEFYKTVLDWAIKRLRDPEAEYFIDIKRVKPRKIKAVPQKVYPLMDQEG